MKRKIILQHRQTKAYVSGGEVHQWTHCVASARFFETPYQALHYCVDREVENFDVIFHSSDGQQERFLRC